MFEIECFVWDFMMGCVATRWGLSEVCEEGILLLIH